MWQREEIKQPGMVQGVTAQNKSPFFCPRVNCHHFLWEQKNVVKLWLINQEISKEFLLFLCWTGVSQDIEIGVLAILIQKVIISRSKLETLISRIYRYERKFLNKETMSWKHLWSKQFCFVFPCQCSNRSQPWMNGIGWNNNIQLLLICGSST